jgi:hypothetical protein
MKLNFFAALGLILTLLVSSVASAGRTPRNDNPGHLCDAQDWQALAVDPYIPLNGNTDSAQDLPTFFNPGTVTTGDLIVVCLRGRFGLRIRGRRLTRHPIPTRIRERP